MVAVNSKISWVLQEGEQAGVQHRALALREGSCMVGKMGRKQKD